MAGGGIRDVWGYFRSLPFSHSFPLFFSSLFSNTSKIHSDAIPSLYTACPFLYSPLVVVVNDERTVSAPFTPVGGVTDVGVTLPSFAFSRTPLLFPLPRPPLFSSQRSPVLDVVEDDDHVERVVVVVVVVVVWLELEPLSSTIVMLRRPYGASTTDYTRPHGNFLRSTTLDFDVADGMHRLEFIVLSCASSLPRVERPHHHVDSLVAFGCPARLGRRYASTSTGCKVPTTPGPSPHRRLSSRALWGSYEGWGCCIGRLGAAGCRAAPMDVEGLVWDMD
ncbi:hypothetical protein D9611_010099 [Ephemerocybe angulata]|uniref:Uncharacterized protein n=1 Tax=Ephemerocybe angulata TaxID=980116 RepID=A0A8H5EVF0_9AGAR|nr:hypothetical protein D9611_010099 [Tulosesus angulatus]